MCLGAFDTGDGSLQVSGRPMRACHPRRRRAMPERSEASATTRTFAFMPNGASGDLSVIDADKWKIVDLSQNSSGYGRVPLGALPEQISASDDGCRLVSANRGSCDMTVVDPSALLGPMLQGVRRRARHSIRAASRRRRAIRGDGTPLAVAPYEVVFLPTDTAALTDGEQPLPRSRQPAGDAVARAGHVPVVRSGGADRAAVGQHHRFGSGRTRAATASRRSAPGTCRSARWPTACRPPTPECRRSATTVAPTVQADDGGGRRR